MAMVITRELLRRLPKAELHCHLDGSVRPITLLELGREYGKSLPAESVHALAEHMLVKDAQSLNEYLGRFSVTLSVMQNAEALERIAYELVEDVASEGVRYIEIRYAPILNTREGLHLGAAVESTVRGLERAERTFGAKARIIICAMRDLSPAVSMELAELAVAYKSRGVVGFDLAGAEAGNPARDHAAAFKFAREHDVALTVHAGEGDGAESVRQALHDCNADRIGHGTRLMEDPSLVEYVTERGIPVEICLTSNVQTGVARSYAVHPLRDYFNFGIKVALNTDNRLMSGTTLTDEYWHAAQHLGFSFDELCDVALTSFENAFLPTDERHDLVTMARSEIAGLRSLS